MFLFSAVSVPSQPRSSETPIRLADDGPSAVGDLLPAPRAALSRALSFRRVPHFGGQPTDFHKAQRRPPPASHAAPSPSPTTTRLGLVAVKKRRAPNYSNRQRTRPVSKAGAGATGTPLQRRPFSPYILRISASCYPSADLLVCVQCPSRTPSAPPAAWRTRLPTPPCTFRQALRNDTPLPYWLLASAQPRPGGIAHASPAGTKPLTGWAPTGQPRSLQFHSCANCALPARPPQLSFAVFLEYARHNA